MQVGRGISRGLLGSALAAAMEMASFVPFGEAASPVRTDGGGPIPQPGKAKNVVSGFSQADSADRGGGFRERERRARQALRGQLRKANGFADNVVIIVHDDHTHSAVGIDESA